MTILNTTLQVPRVGDRIFVPTAGYIGHGVDDVQGGKATVSLVKDGTSGGRTVPFVSVKELPGRSYNWEVLGAKQEELKGQFGEGQARPDPDYSAEFNKPDFL